MMLALGPWGWGDGEALISMLGYTQSCVWYLQRKMLHLDQYGIIENLNNRRVALLSGMDSGVHPLSVPLLTSAPNSMSVRTTASWP